MTGQTTILPPLRRKPVSETGFVYCIRDRALRELFERLLKECRVPSAHCAMSIDEVELIFRHKANCHVLVFDIVDGADDYLNAVSFIRRNDFSPDRTIPIVALGKSWTQGLIVQCRDSGVTGVIQPEMTVQSLFTRLMRVMYSDRNFIISDTYCGPDRRTGKITGWAGPYRRSTDRLVDRFAQPILPNDGAELSATSSLKQTRCLIVDGNVFVRRMIREMLRQNDIVQTEEAKDGAQALYMAESDLFNLILININAPVVNAIEFLTKVRHSKIPALKMISVIGYADDILPATVALCRDEGMNDIMIKPFSAAVLSRKLSTTLVSPRPFIVTDTYVGPCRRRKVDLSAGLFRRAEDQDALQPAVEMSKVPPLLPKDAESQAGLMDRVKSTGATCPPPGFAGGPNS